MIALLAIIVTFPAQPATAQTTPFIIDSAQPKPPQPPSISAQPAQGAMIIDIRNVQPFLLKSVSVEATSLGSDALAAAMRPFIGKVLDGGGIRRVAESVASTYRTHSDIAFYTVVVPAQKFETGVLRLVAIEGYVEETDIRGDTDGDITLIKDHLAPLRGERPLRRSTLSLAAAQIRQIPGTTADIRASALAARGALRLIVAIKRVPFGASVNVNRRGTAFLGDTEFVARLSAYNLLQEGEQYDVVYATSSSTGRFRFVSASLNEPLADDGSSFSLAGGYLRTKPSNLIGPGEAENVGITFAHPLLLSSDTNWTLSGSFTGLNSTNAIFGVRAARERVRAVRLGSAYVLGNTSYTVSLNGTASFGLDALGAHTASPTTGVSNFQKITLRLSYAQMLNDVLVLRFRSGGQYAFERLPVSEFLPLGGAEFGRAFAGGTIAGDDALASAFEVAWQPRLGIDSSIARPELYGYIDGGNVRVFARGDAPATVDSLESAGFGIRSTLFGKLASEVEVGRQLHVPLALSVRPSWQLSFSATLYAP